MSNSNYYLGIMTAIVGLMMLLAAEPVVQVLVIVLGICAALDGGFMLAAVAPLNISKRFKAQCIARGVVGIVLGLLCIVLPLRIAQFAWQTFVYVLAVYSLFVAIMEIPIALDLRRDGFPVRRHAITIAVSAALALILFLLPSSAGFTIIRIGGALLLISGAATTFMAWKNRDLVADDAVVRDE